MMPHTTVSAGPAKLIMPRTYLLDWEQFSSSPFYKEQSQQRTRVSRICRSILQRTELGSHSPVPSIATSSSSFPSIINNDIGKWKHSLGLNAQREFLGLKIWIAWTLDWSNLGKIPNWTLDGVGKFNLDFAPT